MNLHLNFIQRFSLITLFVMGCSADVLAQPYEFDDAWGDHSLEIWNPTSVAVDRDDHIIIADTGNSRIQVCNHDGDCSIIGELGDGPGQFWAPNGVTVDNDDRIVIADTQNHRIQRCTLQGQCEILFGQQGPDIGQFDYPTGVAVDDQGQILVTDLVNNRIQVCSELGACSAFGTFGAGPGQFSGPSGIDLDSQGNIVISDQGNHRIQICDYDGICTQFGSYGNGLGEFYSPQQLAVDSEDQIIVVERSANRVQVCRELTYCLAFGERGQGEGQFEAPRGVGVDSDGNIIVADSINSRIQIWRNAGLVINAGLNDAWVSAGAEKQGFFVTVFPDTGFIFLSWFTFDSVLPDPGVDAVFGAPGQRWVTALGTYLGDTAVLSAELTHGGMFNTSDPLAQQVPGYGTFTITWLSCSEAVLSYEFPGLGFSGQMTLTRTLTAVSYTHLTLPTIQHWCRSRWSPYH